MFAKFIRGGAFNRAAANRIIVTPVRHGGGGHHKKTVDDLKIPQPHGMIGNGLLIVTYLWIMWRFKEDNGQLFGFNKAWKQAHHHDHDHEHIDYEAMKEEQLERLAQGKF